MEFLLDPGFWIALLSVSLVQIALGADNLIIITIIAGKLPPAEQPKAVKLGLILAMVFRIVLLAGVSLLLRYATTVFYSMEGTFLGLHMRGDWSGKAVILMVGGLFLIWKGVKELRAKTKAVEHEVGRASKFVQVVSLIVGLNLLFSVDSILTVVGMTDRFSVMVGSVVISVLLMLAFADSISTYMTRNPDFEILGLFVLLLIGFVLILEGGHVAHLEVNESTFPYIPQWIVIFILMLMFSTDLFQNWVGNRREEEPVHLHRRKK